MNDSASEHIAESLGSNLRLPLSPQGLADFFRAHINSGSHPVTQPLQITNLQLQPQLQEQDNDAVDQQTMLDLGLQLAQENNYESTTKVEEAPKNKRRGGGGAKKTKRENTASPGAISSEKISPFPIQDDYKWRKYGQKTLKGSEFPRDYFKCSVPQCNAKKQVEKCIENGEEKLRYIYFGEHSHPPPKSSHLYAKDQQSFKTAVIAAFDPFVAEADKLNSEFLEELEEEAVDGMQQIDTNNNMIGGVELTDGQVAQTDPTHQEQQEHHQQNYEVLDNNKLLMTTSAEDQVLSMLKDDGTQQNQQNGGMIDPNLIADYVQVENGTIQGDQVMDGAPAMNYEEYMQGEQQPPAKKRKVTRKKSANSQIRRLIVECTKDIDYMEDGYHWRKYGQKTLKGNPFPRSYYKCIEPNCSVRKQVEQTLGGSIINIYEGYHNHPGNPQAVPNEAHKRKHHEMAQAEIDNTLFNTLLSELNDGQSSPKRLKTGEENVPNGLLNTSMLLTTSGNMPITFDMANLQYLFTHSSVPNILKGSAQTDTDNSNNTNNTNVQLVESTNTLNNNNANDNVSSENDDHLLNTSAEQLNDVNLPNVDGSVDEQSTM